MRYEHLEDTDNNTFRALRIIDPTAPEGQRNVMYAEFVDLPNWNYSEPALEYELFDLDTDPYQMKNIYKAADPSYIATLHTKLAKLFTCRGTDNCN